MALLEKQLAVKKSTLPGAGKGLFTQKPIPKGTRILEYVGTRTTWAKVDHKDGSNGYIYYITKKKVIDAGPHPESLGRYANDAKGLVKVKGLVNNAHYVEEGERVFVEAMKDIPAGGEIFVAYGKEYWDTIRYNMKIDKQREKEHKEEEKKLKKKAKEKAKKKKKK